MKRKWFPTGNLAWRECSSSTTAPCSVGDTDKDQCYELVQEVYEIEERGGYGDLFQTGRIEWRPVPVLPSNPPRPQNLSTEQFPAAWTSPLLTQAPNIAGPDQSSNPATG
jgi:hypothetical protein